MLRWYLTTFGTSILMNKDMLKISDNNEHLYHVIWPRYKLLVTITDYQSPHSHYQAYKLRWVECSTKHKCWRWWLSNDSLFLPPQSVTPQEVTYFNEEPNLTNLLKVQLEILSHHENSSKLTEWPDCGSSSSWRRNSFFFHLLIDLML